MSFSSPLGCKSGTSRLLAGPRILLFALSRRDGRSAKRRFCRLAGTSTSAMPPQFTELVFFKRLFRTRCGQHLRGAIVMMGPVCNDDALSNSEGAPSFELRSQRIAVFTSVF